MKDKRELLAELEQLNRDIPTPEEITSNADSAVVWFSTVDRVLSKLVLKKLSLHKAGMISTRTNPGETRARYEALKKNLLEHLSLVRYDCRKSGSAVISAGATYDYFDEIRKRIESAKTDILFVDPYLDADFIAKYMPFVGSTVSTRLLTSDKQASKQAAAAGKAYSAQEGTSIEPRKANSSLHDRYLFIDQATCYISGASFKDGAQKSNTTITEFRDVFLPVRDFYEDLWSKGTAL